MALAAKKRTYLGEKVLEGLYAVAAAAVKRHAKERGWKITKEEVEDAVSDAVCTVMMEHCKRGRFVGFNEEERDKLEWEVGRLAVAFLEKEKRRQKRELLFSDLIVEDDDEIEAAEAIDLLLQHSQMQQQFYYDDECAETIFQFLRSIILCDKNTSNKRKQTLLRTLEAVYLFALSKNPADLRELVYFTEQWCNVGKSGAWKMLTMLQEYFKPYEFDTNVVYILAPILARGGENDD